MYDELEYQRMKKDWYEKEPVVECLKMVGAACYGPTCPFFKECCVPKEKTIEQKMREN